MNSANRLGRGWLVLLAVALITGTGFEVSEATSQWSRKTGMNCASCHTVFPRLNPVGDQFLRNGYDLLPAHQRTSESEESAGGVVLGKVEHLLGFRLNMTPLQAESNALQKDSASAKSTRWTVGSPIWIQFFVAGPIYKNLSFFSELEYAASSFKFNWFYFNLTDIGKTTALNAQIGNVSPLEFASYPNRLPQLPALKGEVMLIKSSAGKGEASVDISSARPGIQYFGYNDWALVYAGLSPGTKPTQVNQFINYWGGVVLKMPDATMPSFAGSTATLHYYAGTDTKGTGTVAQMENRFTRLSPQVNIRYVERFDLQAAYVIGKDENSQLVASPTEDFKFQGIALEGGYMPSPRFHLGLHYDQYASDNKIPAGPKAGDPVIEFQRVVPAITMIMNENIRASIYFEKNLLELPKDQKVDKLYLNLRLMI